MQNTTAVNMCRFPKSQRGTGPNPRKKKIEHDQASFLQSDHSFDMLMPKESAVPKKPIRYTSTENISYVPHEGYRVDAAPADVKPRHLKIDMNASIEQNVDRVRSDIRKGKDRAAEGCGSFENVAA